MMKTKKATSKFVSILSVVLALAMLSTTVFASGVLSGLMVDDTIEITNNGEVIELADKPFIENGEVYLPLRETFEKVGVMEHPESAMEWNEGKIDLTIAYDADNAYTTHVQPIPGQETDTVSFIYSYALEIGKPSLADTNIVLINAEGQGVPNEQVMSNSPVLRGGHTYIPYSYMDYLLKDERWNIGYIIYDKDGNPVDVNGFYHNAENLSKNELETLQIEVDNGHYPWRLDPQQVILAFMDQQGLSGGEIQALAGSSTVSASYVHNSVTYEVELYRPIDQNEHGILVVKSCVKRS